jgi:hypothetical protein
MAKAQVIVWSQECVGGGNPSLFVESEEEFTWMHINENQGIGKIEIVARIFGDSFAEAFEMAEKLM